MFDPQNDLEHDLVRAANEPVHRAAFLRELLDAPVFLALLLADGSRVEAGPDGEAVIPAGARLEICAVPRAGVRAMPVFTSRLRAQAFYERDHVIAPDTVRDIFMRHPGTAYVFNPGSDYALDLSEADVAVMLRGDANAH